MACQVPIVDLTQDDNDDDDEEEPKTPKRRPSPESCDRSTKSRSRSSRRGRVPSTTWEDILAPVTNSRSSSPLPPAPPKRSSPAARAEVQNLIRANHANKTRGISRRRSGVNHRKCVASDTSCYRSSEDVIERPPVTFAISTSTTSSDVSNRSIIRQIIHHSASVPSTAYPPFRPSQSGPSEISSFSQSISSHMQLSQNLGRRTEQPQTNGINPLPPKKRKHHQVFAPPMQSPHQPMPQTQVTEHSQVSRESKSTDTG